MRPWLVAALGYVVAVGFVGVIGKLSLRYVHWSVILLTTTLAYIVFTLVLGIARGIVIPAPSLAGLGFALLTGLLVAGSFVLFMVALTGEDVGRVVPITAAYPLVSAVAANVILSESLDLTRIIGISLIVAGVILVAR